MNLASDLSPPTRRVVACLGVIVAIALYALFVNRAPVLDQFALFPSTMAIHAGAANRKAVAFQGGELEIWIARSRPAQKTGEAKMFLLRFYGNADRAERWVAAEAEMFGERAIEVWGVNYPGFGGSTGPARLARIAPAAEAAFDELKRQAGERPVFVYGASLGATAALHLGASRPIAGLIVHNPPPLREMILRQFGWWNLWLLAGPLSLKVPAELDSIANAKASRARAIFLLSDSDEVVAPRFQTLVANAYAGEKRDIVLRSAYHNSPIEGAGLREFQAALDWLMR